MRTPLPSERVGGRDALHPGAMHQPDPRIPHRLDAFAVSEGSSLGFSQHALRDGSLAAPTRGVRLPSAVGDASHDLFAALLAVQRPRQFFSHATAALIHGLPVPRRIGLVPIHVASPSFTARMRRPGVVGHRVKARVVEVSGFAVESLEDCFIHVASVLDHDELVAVGDAIVATGRTKRLTVGELSEHAEHFRGARGMSRVGRALGAIRVGAESPRETRLRLVLVRGGIPEPELQIVVCDEDGAFIGRLDMGWRAIRVGVEYDGQHHRLDDRQYAVDVERHRRLQEAGWTVVRVTARDLDDGGRRVVQIVRATLRRAGAGDR